METETWHLPEPAGCVGGGLNKRAMASASIYVWKKAAPLTLALRPDNSVPPCMSLKVLELLP